jgi:RNA polymerase sigma-70 factor (ECF subfamily)
MTFMEQHRHLTNITTLWSEVVRAHDGGGSAAHAAQAQLLERYGGAVRRYLRGAVREPDVADELFQEFAVRFLEGKLRGADPDRGRFRDFLKGVLRHLIANYHNRQKRDPRLLGAVGPEPAVAPPSVSDFDRDFLTTWRDELLARAWEALAKTERAKQRPLYTVLRFRAEHPDLPSPRMAEELAVRLGRPLNAAAVRQMLHRAREAFADLLLAEVAQSLDEPTRERLEDELIAVGLLEHCRPALERLGK